MEVKQDNKNTLTIMRLCTKIVSPKSAHRCKKADFERIRKHNFIAQPHLAYYFFKTTIFPKWKEYIGVA